MTGEKSPPDTECSFHYEVMLNKLASRLPGRLVRTQFFRIGPRASSFNLPLSPSSVGVINPPIYRTMMNFFRAITGQVKTESPGPLRFNSLDPQRSTKRLGWIVIFLVSHVFLFSSECSEFDPPFRSLHFRLPRSRLFSLKMKRSGKMPKVYLNSMLKRFVTSRWTWQNTKEKFA